MSLVQKTTFAIAGGTSGSGTLNGVVAGNTLVVLGSYTRTGASNAQLTPSDSVAGTLSVGIAPTLLTTVDGPTGAGIWHALSVASGTHVVTFTDTTGIYGTFTVAEFSNITSLDKTTSNGNSSAASSTGGNTGTTVATTVSTELIVAALAVECGVGKTNAGISTPATSGYTSLAVQQNTGTNTGGEQSYKEVSSTGTQTASWTWTADTSMHAWQGVIATYVESSGVTKSLTGQSLSSSEGAASRALAYSPTGQALTSALGSISAQVSYGLAGESISSAAGALTVAWSGSVTLAGQGISSTLGAILPAASYSATGQSLSSTLGMSAPAVSYAPTGQSISSTLGSVSATVLYGLSGQNLVLTEGVITASTGGDVTLSLAGQGVSSSLGSLGVALGVTVPGQISVSGLGSINASLGYTATGQEMEAALGALTSSLAANVTGQLSNFSIGTITESGGTPITGGVNEYVGFLVNCGSLMGHR